MTADDPTPPTLSDLAAERYYSRADARRRAEQLERRLFPERWEIVPELPELDAIFGPSYRRKSQEG